MKKLTFQLLHRRVCLEGQSEALEPYRKLLEHFAAAEPGTPDLGIRIAVPSMGPGELHLVDRAASERIRVSSRSEAFGCVYSWLLDRVALPNNDSLCLHACGLSRRDRAVAIAAPSRHGKSTLALALAHRGFTVLSDELTVLEPRTARLVPFPLAVGCRPGTERLLPFLAGAPRRGLRLGNVRLVPALDAGRRVDPAPLSAMLFVEPTPAEPAGTRRYRLTVRPAEDDVAAELQSIEGVLSARTEDGGRRVRLELERDAWVAPAVRELLARRSILVEEVEDLDLPLPDFTADPRLERLSLSEGVIGMLRHLRAFGALESCCRSREHGLGSLVMELARSMSRVRFFRLTPGRLSPMLSAIESVHAA